MKKSNSIQFSFSLMSDSLLPHGLQHTRPPCPSPNPRACSSSCPSSQWCHPNISSSVIPFSSCLQSFPASGYFPMSQFFTSGGQSIGASASASVLPVNIQCWFPLRLTGLISLQSKRFPRFFSNTTVQKHQFFGAQLSLWSNSYNHTCMYACMLSRFSRVRLCVTLWIVAHEAPPSMGFSRQEYWSGLPFPSAGDLPDPGIKPRSPALQAEALTSEPPGKSAIQTKIEESRENY